MLPGDFSVVLVRQGVFSIELCFLNYSAPFNNGNITAKAGVEVDPVGCCPSGTDLWGGVHPLGHGLEAQGFSGGVGSDGWVT